MRRGKLRSLALLLVLLMFAAGLAIFLYPYLWGAMVDREISLNAQDFLNRDETEPTIPEVIVTIDSPTETEETRDYPELWADMVRYNETIYTQGQAGLSCQYDYQKPSFRLSDYGFGDEVFGAISIPATWAITICIFIVIYGRMIEVYLVTSVVPIPMATMANREWGQMGQNYLRTLFALGFQAFLIMVCVAIYSVLVQNISVSGDISNAIWTCMGYTVLLCFCLFKTSSLARSVFNAH